MSTLVLAPIVGVSLARSITVASIVLSMVGLAFAFRKARARLPLRPVFDYARLALQVTAVLIMAALSGVSTPLSLVAGVVLIGLGLGYFQATSLEISIDGGKVFLRRSLVGVAIWGGGLIVMQGAGLANRAGVVRLGQAIAWFSIGVTIGLLVGRQPRVADSLRLAGGTALVVALVVGSAGLVFLTPTPPVAAQNVTCPAAPSGWTFTQGGGGNCSYESVGRTAAVSASGGGMCGADLAEHWAGFSGSPGSGGTINIKSDGSNGFEKWLVLTPNSVISIAANNVDGPGIAEKFLGAATEYGRLNYPACAAEPSPTTTVTSGTNPPPTTAAPRTTIETESIPDDAPPVAPIDDEGAALTSTTTTPPTTNESVPDEPATTTSVAEATSTSSLTPTTTVSSVDPEETASPPVVEGSDDTDAGEEDITESEAVQQAVAGLLLAGLLGLLSWGEAFQAIDAITGASPGTAQSNHGHLQQQAPDYRKPTAPQPATVPAGATTPPPGSTNGSPPGPVSTPVSTYIPTSGTTPQAPSEPSWVPSHTNPPSKTPAGPSWGTGESAGGSENSAPDNGTPEGNGNGTGGDAGNSSGADAGNSSGPSFGDWALGELEDAQLDPNGAPTTEVPGAMGSPHVRLSDRDGDGTFDHAEYDEDHDGIYERSGPLGPDGRLIDAPESDPDGTGVPPTETGPDAIDSLLDALEDGPHLGPEAAEPMEVDIAGHRTRFTDTDGDGEYDFAEGDTDGDGEFDTSGRLTTGPDGEPIFTDDDPTAAAGNDQGSAEADQDPADAGGLDDLPAIEPESLTQREVEDLWSWGLERGRSIEDIRQDIEGLQQARGATVPAPDPFGIASVKTPNGEVPLTPGEAAHHSSLRRDLESLHRQRDAFNAQWEELLEARRRATNRELISHIRKYGAAVEVWEAETGIQNRIAEQRDWIRVYKMWRAGDTWANGPDGSSFYNETLSEYELNEAIRRSENNIDQIERDRIKVIEAARRRRNSSDALDRLDGVQDALMAQRRQLDVQIDGIQGQIDRYESFGSGRPLPDR